MIEWVNYSTKSIALATEIEQKKKTKSKICGIFSKNDDSSTKIIFQLKIEKWEIIFYECEDLSIWTRSHKLHCATQFNQQNNNFNRSIVTVGDCRNWMNEDRLLHFKNFFTPKMIYDANFLFCNFVMDFLKRNWTDTRTPSIWWGDDWSNICFS